MILPVFQAMMYISTILFLYLGSNLIISNELKAGDLTGILSYVMQTFNSLIMLSNVFVSIAKSLASTYRVSEVLNVTCDLISGEEMNKVDNIDIEFKDVSFKYKQGNGENVLSNISFKLESGKTLGILGSTGSAKSTLVSLIPRLYDVTSGEILIGGKNVKTYDLVDLRNNISFVLQTASLFEGTLLDNLKWAKKDIDEEELKNVLDISCVNEYLDKLPDGLNTNIGVSGNNLSGGQKQRLCLARAILKNPKLLILDDSTSAVDTKTEKKIRTGLQKLNMSKIIISQRILSVLEADYVLILENGRINEINTPSELLKHNPIFQDLYDRQLKGVDLSE